MGEVVRCAGPRPRSADARPSGGLLDPRQGATRPTPVRQDVVVDVTDLDFQSRLLARLPIVNAFYDRLGIDLLAIERARFPADRDRSRVEVRLAPPAALTFLTLAPMRLIALPSSPESVG